MPLTRWKHENTRGVIARSSSESTLGFRISDAWHFPELQPPEFISPTSVKHKSIFPRDVFAHFRRDRRSKSQLSAKLSPQEKVKISLKFFGSQSKHFVTYLLFFQSLFDIRHSKTRPKSYARFPPEDLDCTYVLNLFESAHRHRISL